jgi:hypothetical protein
MIVIGVDVHKHSLCAVAVDEVGRQLDCLETSDGEELVSWSKRVGRRRLWALEDCRHVTRGLERTLQRERLTASAGSRGAPRPARPGETAAPAAAAARRCARRPASCGAARGAQLRDLRRRDPRLRQLARDSNLSSRSQSARSVFARGFRPRLTAVSAGSARFARCPARATSSTTNRQPVVPSSAKSTSCGESKRANHSRTDSRVAGVIRARDNPPLRTSTIAYVICRR